MSATASNLAAADRALSEGSTFRAVQRVRLTLPDREAEFAIRTALEDALRTADFGDAGRLIVVRSLILKGLPRGASGPRIARSLERAWRSLAPFAVAFDAPGAERANIVYFRSMHAARLAWLRRFAQVGPPAEWFWSRAAPELAERPAHAALVPLLVALQAATPQALAREIAALPPATVRRLLAALPVVRVAALLGPEHETALAVPALSRDTVSHVEQVSLKLSARRTPPPARDDAALRREPLEAIAKWHRGADRCAQLAEQVSIFGRSDWRMTWFAAQLIRADTGEAPAARVPAALVIEAASTGRARATPRAATPPAASLSPAVSARRTDSVFQTPGAQVVPQTPGASLRVDEGLPQPSPGAARRGSLGPVHPWLEDNQFTAFGGLLMLLNALEVLQFPAWLDLQPAPTRSQFARALLARIARRLRMPTDDPQEMLLTDDAVADRALRKLSCRWGDFRWPLGFEAGGLLPALPELDVAASLWRWKCALVRLLRRDARVGLAHLVVRPAGVSITSTHVDVVLPLAGADTALRRTGLDRDPGWVAWFGWIVAFHYMDGARDGTG